MRRLGIVLLCCAALASAEELPHARDVVVRRSGSLTHALRVATGPAWRNGRVGRQVAIIVDVTPYTAKSRRSLMEALESLHREAAGVVAWRIAPLGGTLVHAHCTPHAVAAELSRILSEPTPSKNTMRDLHTTISSFRVQDGVIVYLADWHFEDDDGIENLVRLLRGRRQVFSTVGSEAAFSRGWNDGFFPSERQRTPRGGDQRYDSRIGRDPFGPRKHDAPWHGGDTAYPHLPAYIDGSPWWSEFATRIESDDTGLEDLTERLNDTRKRSAGEGGAYPLPSSFGPYGLMRLAATSGGRYVLWSFNRAGRSNVEYEYGRCDHYAPDLRARRTILADHARRPLARALLDAWHLVAGHRVGLARVTPPIDADRFAPREMKLSKGRCPSCFGFRDRSAVQELLRSMKRVLEALDRAITVLDGAIGRTPGRPDDIDVRLLADAQLFRHILAVQRFSLGEVNEIARTIPDSAWDHADKTPAIFREEFLLRGEDPEHALPRTTLIFDRQRGADLAVRRQFLLRKYAGTPFGETIARNEVCAYRFGWGRKRPDNREGKNMRTPAQSADTPGPATAPGAGSSGTSGPTSQG